jgi:hypothetical protein
MSSIERKAIYFVNPGPENTRTVIEAVKYRISSGGLKTVVVASTSGKTGFEFARSMGGLASLVVVSHQEMEAINKQRIEKYGGKALDQTHLPMHSKGVDQIRKSFYSFGQGFKVAVEVVLIASDKGEISLYDDVIGVGGTGTGADTAIVVRATKSNEIFADEESKKLEIREVLAMPLKKYWW